MSTPELVFSSLPDSQPPLDEREVLEMELLLQAVNRHYGYDFSKYSDKVLYRRLSLLLGRTKLQHLSELIPKLLHDPGTMRELLSVMSVTVTEFFRDPPFFATCQEKMIPILRTYPFISIWCAGCATGEEAYSWAILLQEAGLLEKSRIYATDINDVALAQAREGVFSEEVYQTACLNYSDMGGKYHFDRYCQHNYGAIKMQASLQKYITFAQHNLVHDGVFGEMVVVSCRNVMIYFNRDLKSQCVNLFFKSLTNQGFLCLGESEGLDQVDINSSFDVLDRRRRIFQKSHSL